RTVPAQRLILDRTPRSSTPRELLLSHYPLSRCLKGTSTALSIQLEFRENSVGIQSSNCVYYKPSVPAIRSILHVHPGSLCIDLGPELGLIWNTSLNTRLFSFKLGLDH